MSRDGSGNYSLPSGNPVTTNTVISSTWANSTLSDLGAALTQSLSKDGQTTPTANLTMGNFRLISLAAGTNRTDAVNVGQVQDNTPAVLSSIAGTGDAITAATAPAIAAYATDSKFVYTPTTTNTLTNPTIAIDGLAAKTITQSNGVGLWSGALVVGTPYELLYDGTNFRVQSGQLAQGIPYYQSRTSHRNYIVDGNFDFWRNGISFTIPTNNFQYTADMWLAGSGGGSSSITVTQNVFTAGAAPAGMATPAVSFMKLAQTVAATATGSFISHHVESSRTLEAHSATLSMWLWVDSGTITIPNLAVVQNFGSGGSAAVTTTIPLGWVVTTTPTKFSSLIAVPSITGKTIGQGSFLATQLQLPVSTTFALNTTQWQLEDSPANAPATGLPTPFELRGLDAEIARVNRFVQPLGDTNIFSLQIVGTGVFTTATNFQAIIPLISPMRAQPFITFVSGSAASLVIASSTGFNPSAIALITTTSSTTLISANCTVASATPGQAGNLRFNTAGVLIADARL